MPPDIKNPAPAGANFPQNLEKVPRTAAELLPDGHDESAPPASADSYELITARETEDLASDNPQGGFFLYRSDEHEEHITSFPRSAPPIVLKPALVGQINQTAQRLLPFDSEITNFTIQEKMDAISELLSLLPEAFNPMSERFNDKEVKKSIYLNDLFLLVFLNLASMIKDKPEWLGIGELAKRLIKPFKDNLWGYAQNLVLAVERLHSLTLFRASYVSFEWSNGYLGTIQLAKLNNKIYRQSAAETLFYYSRGNAALSSVILDDLYRLVENEATREFGILLIREFIRISKTVETDDALLVRDYSQVVGSDAPFYLLTTPTIFPPEKWTETMLDGLKKGDFSGKTMAEIGTGSGVLSIFMAKYGKAKRIYSYDLNRDARKVAFINAWIASTDQNGKKLEGSPPADIIEFGDTPDLLLGMPPNLRIDEIFGCIPQVPSQDQLTPRNLADRYSSRGYPEDKDGLELLARLLEQSAPRLNQGGSIHLVVSGRPGLLAIQQMADRRGFIPRMVHETVFMQDKWTDLSRFVSIEKEGRRAPFEFLWGGRVISAEEASARLHEFREKFLDSQSVEERQSLLTDPAYAISHRQFIIRFFPQAQFHTTWEDEAYQALHNQIVQTRQIPYTPETASEYPPFRKRLALHLSRLSGFQIPEGALFIAPSLKVLLDNLSLAAYSTGKDIPPVTEAFLDNPELDLQKIFKEGFSGFTLFRINPAKPNQMALLVELLIKHPEHRNHVGLIWQNSDLPAGETPLATLITWNKVLHETLARMGEDTYSRVSTLQAIFETSLLESRQRLALTDSAPLGGSPLGGSPLVPSPSFVELNEGEEREEVSPLAFALKSFKAHPLKLDRWKGEGVIDLSFGESEFPIPEKFVAPLQEGLRKGVEPLQVRGQITRYLRETGRGNFTVDEVRLGAGVHPLMAQTLKQMGEEGLFRVMILQGSYGQFFPTIHLAGGDGRVVPLPPLSKDGDSIMAMLQSQAGSAAVLLLSYPTNPAGLYYSTEALRGIVRFCMTHGIIILADEIFFMTGDEKETTSLFHLMDEPEFASFLQTHLIGYSGLSKEFALGGARFGFVFSRNTALLDKIEKRNLHRPTLLALRIAHTVYSSPSRESYISEHREWLHSKRHLMTEFLKPYAEKGILDFHEPQAGFCVEVDVSPLFGKRLTIEEKKYEVDSDGNNLREIVFNTTGIKVSPVGWSGNPNTIRLVYSIQNLEEALERLKPFLDSALTSVGPKGPPPGAQGDGTALLGVLSGEIKEELASPGIDEDALLGEEISHEENSPGKNGEEQEMPALIGISPLTPANPLKSGLAKPRGIMHCPFPVRGLGL